MINPPRSAFRRNLLLDRESTLVQLVRHQRPAHSRNDLVVLKQVGQLSTGGPKLADVRLQRDQLLFHLLQLCIVRLYTAVGSDLPKPSTSAAMYMVERSSQNDSFSQTQYQSSAHVAGALGKALVS